MTDVGRFKKYLGKEVVLLLDARVGGYNSSAHVMRASGTVSIEKFEKPLKLL